MFSQNSDFLEVIWNSRIHQSSTELKDQDLKRVNLDNFYECSCPKNLKIGLLVQCVKTWEFSTRQQTRYIGLFCVNCCDDIDSRSRHDAIYWRLIDSLNYKNNDGTPKKMLRIYGFTVNNGFVEAVNSKANVYKSGSRTLGPQDTQNLQKNIFEYYSKTCEMLY